MEKQTSIPLSVLSVLVRFFFIISASVAVPVLWRGFYFLHIKALDLPAATGFDETVIRTAYNEMMDFCTGNAPFGTGALRWSDDGMQHFADVRKLFRLDLTVLALCIVALVLLALLARRFRPHRFLGRSPSFWAGCGVLVLGGVLTVLAAIDFDRAFVVFHKLFFPGKTNWIFDYRTDEIILILPQVYFRNCAILAVSVMAVFCAVFMITGHRKA